MEAQERWLKISVAALLQEENFFEEFHFVNGLAGTVFVLFVWNYKSKSVIWTAGDTRN